MRRRIFIAINLPENAQKKLEDFQRKWLDLPARWTKKDNLHITLIFLGYISDEELLEVCQTAKEVALRNPCFEIKLNKVLYGPPKKTPPRMVWVEGEKSKEFTALRDDLEKSLLQSGKVNVLEEGRTFSPHITLARIKTWQWKEIEPEERPAIEEELNLSFPVGSIEIMESHLRREGPQYDILESWPLKN